MVTRRTRSKASVDPQQALLFDLESAIPELEAFSETARGPRGSRLVTLLLEKVQALGADKDPWPTVERLYVGFLEDKLRWSPNQARQSWVAASGSSFQGMVRDALNNELHAEGIRAISVSELVHYPSSIRSFLTLPARRRCLQASFEAWPDNDIILLTRSPLAEQENMPVAFAILSCKTSFHSRETESCFWALATRDTGMRMGLVTQDRKGELGTCANPTKARMLLEAYFDRVFSTNPLTRPCPQIRPFNDIFEEARRWRRDVAPEYVGDAWS